MGHSLPLSQLDTPLFFMLPRMHRFPVSELEWPSIYVFEKAQI